MLNFGPTFIFAIINLLILYFILKKVFFNRVTEFMEKRTASIQTEIENAGKDRKEAGELKQSLEEKMKQAHVDAAKILSDMKKRAEEEHDSLVQEAKEQARFIISKAHEEIERERRQMLKEIRNETASLALSAASKVLEAQMDTEKNRELVNKFLDEEGVA